MFCLPVGLSESIFNYKNAGESFDTQFELCYRWVATKGNKGYPNKSEKKLVILYSSFAKLFIITKLLCFIFCRLRLRMNFCCWNKKQDKNNYEVTTGSCKTSASTVVDEIFGNQNFLRMCNSYLIKNRQPLIMKLPRLFVYLTGHGSECSDSTVWSIKRFFGWINDKIYIYTFFSSFCPSTAL